MRVALVIDRFDPERGGAEAYLDQLARYLRERGHDVRILCWRAAAAGPDLERIPAPPWPRLLREVLLAMRSSRRARSFDVSLAVRHVLAADVYQPHGGAYTTGERAALECRGGVRRVMGSLLHAISPKHCWFRALERQVLRRSGTVVALSRVVLHELRPRVAAGTRLELLHNGVDVERFSPLAAPGEGDRVRAALGVSAGARVLLHVAHNYRLKGLEHAVCALAQPALPDDLCLVHVGRSAPRDVLRLAARLGVRERVIHTGAVHDLAPLYRTAAMLVHPTYHDPCSLVTLEALACGTPVITTVRNGASELLTAEAGVILAQPGDARALAAAVAVVLARGEPARVAAREVAERHPWRLHFARMEAVLEAAAHRSGAIADAHVAQPR